MMLLKTVTYSYCSPGSVRYADLLQREDGSYIVRFYYGGHHIDYITGCPESFYDFFEATDRIEQYLSYPD